MPFEWRLDNSVSRYAQSTTYVYIEECIRELFHGIALFIWAMSVLFADFDSINYIDLMFKLLIHFSGDSIGCVLFGKFTPPSDFEQFGENLLRI